MAWQDHLPLVRLLAGREYHCLSTIMGLSELKITLSDVIAAVCNHPERYTLNGTFGEVLAFLEGYANGAMLGNRGRSSSYFNEYTQWLRTRLSLQDAKSWQSFIDLFPNETKALSEFLVLWREFREEHP